MDLRQTILLSILSAIVRVSLQQGIIVSSTVAKSNWTVGDTVTFTCEVVKFEQPAPPPLFFTFMTVARQTWKDSEFSKLVSLEPQKSNSLPKLTTFFPPSKRWMATYETVEKYLDKASTKLILKLTDFQCEDIGSYKCIVAVNNQTDLYDRTGHNLTTTAPITLDLQSTPHNGNEEFASINAVGDNISLRCSVTGPPDIKISWKFAKYPPDEIAYPENDVVFYPETELNSTSGCATRSYISVLAKTVQANEDGSIYYCIVSDLLGKELARKHFTIWFQERNPNNNYKNGVKVLNMQQSLTLLLFVCILKTFLID
ncbi:hypothetical protein Bpfe_006350 [Biomphalaria pfeifferi]|uniref:Ig-like domain-containing protein n=1 Tax=Biomphalaria pfeifferi TaxID=112525 RepID=A0AAD8C0T9_BIOPF|nr:hypothetical protein Bpfe_006350 [Biomphalaria pfeifferi]